MSVHGYVYTCGGQRSACSSWFSPSAVWAPGIEFKLSGSAAKPFLAEQSVQPCFCSVPIGLQQRGTSEQLCACGRKEGVGPSCLPSAGITTWLHVVSPTQHFLPAVVAGAAALPVGRWIPTWRVTHGGSVCFLEVHVPSFLISVIPNPSPATQPYRGLLHPEKSSCMALVALVSFQFPDVSVHS